MASHYASTFRQTFHRRSCTGVDSHGSETYSDAEPIACRHEMQPRLVRDSTGEQVVSTGRLFTEAEVKLTDLLWPPGADPEDYAQSQRPLSVSSSVDLETGLVDHYEVYY